MLAQTLPQALPASSGALGASQKGSQGALRGGPWRRITAFLSEEFSNRTRAKRLLACSGSYIPNQPSVRAPSYRPRLMLVVCIRSIDSQHKSCLTRGPQRASVHPLGIRKSICIQRCVAFVYLFVFLCGEFAAGWFAARGRRKRSCFFLLSLCVFGEFENFILNTCWFRLLFYNYVFMKDIADHWWEKVAHMWYGCDHRNIVAEVFPPYPASC